MGAQLDEGKYFIASVDEGQMMGLYMYLNYIVGIFREKEGLSIVIQEDIREEIDAISENKLKGPYALIVGDSLIKAIGSLEKKKIEGRFYSAYSNDYLFVPYGKRDDALRALKRLQKL
jgi:hypothetical protein